MTTIKLDFESKSTVEVSPRLLAECFWSMSDKEQAEFFHELANVVTEDAEATGRSHYGLGEMQWCYMADAIKKRSPEAREMYLALSGFAYNYWPQKTEWELA